MKKNLKTMAVLAAMAAATATMTTSCGYGEDIDQANDRISKLTERVTNLEVEMAKANGNIAALQSLVEALGSAEYVTGMTEITKGYVLTFRSGKTVTIRDGNDGNDGHSPLIGIKKDSDGVWYWTLDGEWLLDYFGKKVRADGEKGDQGIQGEQGEQGIQGITPQLRINDTSNEWEVSLDEGKTWTSTGVKATGEKGVTGDAFFESVVADGDRVVITLIDGTSFELPLFDTFKKIRDRVQSIVYVPDYADGMIAVDNGQDVTITYNVMPAAMAGAIADQKDKLSYEGQEVMTRTETAALTIKSVEGDAATGKLIVTATASGFTAGQYYAFALTFSDGISAYQTAFTTAFANVNPEAIRIGVYGLQAGMETVRMGSFVQLYVIWNPGYTTNRGIAWTSSDKKKAVVDENGLVTVPDDADDGDVTITATTANGKKATIVLNIADGQLSVNTEQLKQNQAE